MITGGLSLDVHGFGLIVFGQAIWFVVVGISLWRSEEIVFSGVSTPEPQMI